MIEDAESLQQARELYDAGVSYVIFPHFVSGWHMGQLIKKLGKDKEALNKYKARQERVLKNTYGGEY